MAFWKHHTLENSWKDPTYNLTRLCLQHRLLSTIVKHSRIIYLSFDWQNYSKVVDCDAALSIINSFQELVLNYMSAFSAGASLVAQMVKASACNVGDPGSIPGWGRSSGEENGNPLQYSCLENSMDGGAWWATVHGVSKSQTRLSNFTFSANFFLIFWNLFIFN